jgi:hypothetical protein
MHRRHIILLLVGAVLTLGWSHGVGAQTKPAGEFVWALHVTIAPAWFDPAENGGLITPFGVLDIMASVSIFPSLLDQVLIHYYFDYESARIWRSEALEMSRHDR